MITELLPSDSRYPGILKRMHSPPNPLYVQGDLTQFMMQPRVAIVGTRGMTTYGKRLVTQFTQTLVAHSVGIISGLAYGVDAEAHRQALKAEGSTLAVLPGPLNKILPRGNANLARSIVDTGGVLVSGYGPDHESHKGDFVARNEIVAALSDAVIIIEASSSSGTRHTATFAGDLGVPTFAVPGSVEMAQSAGANALIKNNNATLLTSITDVLLTLGINPKSRRVVRGDTPHEQAIIDALMQGHREGDAIMAASKLQPSQYYQALTVLELADKVQALGGNRWNIRA